MTNKEFYKEQIFEMACNRVFSAVDRETHRLDECGMIPCPKCLFFDDECEEALKRWLEEEYMEPSPFEKDELVEVSQDGKIWHLRYFAYQENEVFYCWILGEKSNTTKRAFIWKHCRKYGTLGGPVK